MCRALLLCLILAAPVAAAAQTVAIAQVSGVVTDESGAALPGVDVTVTQVSTGLNRSTITGERGEYVLPNLPVGPYTLKAQLQGFSVYEQSGITLQVGSSPIINVTLKVGALNETVTVSAATTMVEVRSTGVGTVVSEQELVGLPLDGRQPSQLVLLSGAAVTNSTNGMIGSQRQYPSAVAISVAGGTGNSTIYLVDGAFNNDPVMNIGQPLPFPDALQEFKVESGVRPARYGIYTGATVNAVTKAGTNTLHGNLFEFLRDHRFNAINRFATTDDGLNRNQYGGTMGGPIRQNRMFFFGALQVTRNRQRPSDSTAFVPTAAMRAGDFTQVASAECNAGRALTLPSPFVNNQVSPSLFDPIAMKIVNKLPVATDPCGRVTFAVPDNNDEQQTVARFDWQATTDQRVFGRYYVANYDRAPAFDGNDLLLTTGSGLGLDNRVQTFSLGHDYVLTPRLISATRFALARSRIHRSQGSELDSWTSLGSNVWSAATEPGLRFFSLNVTNGFPGAGFPGEFESTTYQVSEDIDWVRNSHQVSFGAAWIRPGLDVIGPFQANGIFTFNGSRVGGGRLGLADMMLGLPSQFRQGGNQLVQQKMNYVGAYVQDVWRLSNRLTLNAGLRWEPYVAPHDEYGFYSRFNMDWFLAGRHSAVFTNAPAGLMFEGDEGFPGNSNTFSKLSQVAPRVGIVWDPRGDNVQTIRAAAGIYYDSPKLWQYGRHPLNAPFGNTVEVTNPASFADPWAAYAGGNPFPTPMPPPSNIRFPLAGTYVTMPFDLDPMEVRQWNVSYQRQFAASWMASVTYLGNRTYNTWIGRELNPAVYTPTATQANLESRRRLFLLNPAEGQYYSTIQEAFGGTGRYDGLVLTLQRRLTNGWTMNTNLTLSDCVNDGEPGVDITNSFPDPDDPSTNEGPCDADRPYILNSSWVYQISGVGGGWLRGLTTDWQIGTVFQARSGSPLTPSTTGNRSLTGLGNQRPLVVGDPDLEDRTINRWFNIDAFAGNPAGSWGDTPRGFLRGPAYWNIDLALSRVFRLTSESRVEVRAEAFNLTNRVHLGNPNVTFGSADFGRITATQGDARVMQFAVKYSF
jgi:carboxypeptidase family protein/TonB-dependent receptor-like protein